MSNSVKAFRRGKKRRGLPSDAPVARSDARPIVAVYHPAGGTPAPAEPVRLSSSGIAGTAPVPRPAGRHALFRQLMRSHDRMGTRHLRRDG